MAINYPDCFWNFSERYLASFEHAFNVTDAESIWLESLGPCEDQFHLLSDSFVYSLIAVYSVVIFIGFFGNLCVIWLIGSTPKLQTPVNVLLLSLSISNLILTITLPWSLIYNISYNYKLPAALCQFFLPIQGMSVMSNIYALLFIAVERHRVTVYPAHKKLFKSPLQLGLVIAILWIASYGFQIPQVVVLGKETVEVTQIVQNNTASGKPQIWLTYTLHYCKEMWSNGQSLAYSIAIIVVEYAIPLTFLAVLYSRIAYFVFVRTPVGAVSLARTERAQNQKRHLLVMLILLVSAFAICWGPYFIVGLICLNRECDSELIPYLQWLGHLNVAIDPILYAVLHVRIRQEFVRKLQRIKRKVANSQQSKSGPGRRNGVRQRNTLTVVSPNNQRKEFHRMNDKLLANIPVVSASQPLADAKPVMTHEVDRPYLSNNVSTATTILPDIPYPQTELPQMNKVLAAVSFSQPPVHTPVTPREVGGAYFNSNITTAAANLPDFVTTKLYDFHYNQTELPGVIDNTKETVLPT